MQTDGTTAFRVFHGEADGIPGLTVDWFNGVAVLSTYVERTGAEERELVDALASGLRPQSLYLKRKPATSAAANRELSTFAPESPAFGEACPEVVALENGLQFEIRPPNGLSVGLYLDMRDTRRWLRMHARDARVLNCFAYTCAFAVAAKAGGAREVINVDLSKKSLEWGVANARLNEQSARQNEYLSGDVFEALRRFAKRGDRFDIVILDPPSFSRSKKKTFTVAKDYPALVGAAGAVSQSGGMIVACCNQDSLSRRRFQTLVSSGLKRVERRFDLVEELGPSPVDFPSIAEPALKVCIVKVE